MIVDVSPEGRARMRRSARFDLDAWCEREEIGCDVVGVELLGRDSDRGFEVRLTFEQKSRRRVRRFVKEYPPASVWWYMTEEQ